MSRNQKFNREFSLLKKHPYFLDIRNLYNENIIKNITSASKLFNSIRVKKDGALYKNSILGINKLNILKKKRPIVVTGYDVMAYANNYLKSNEKYDLTSPYSYPNLVHIWVYFYSNNFFGNYQFNLKYRESLPIDFDFDDEDDEDFSAESRRKEYLAQPYKLRQFDVETTGLSRKAYERYFETLKYQFFIGSDDSIFKLNDKIFIIKGEQVSPKYAKQYFKDSVNEHCFLSPILNWAINKFENSNTKSTQKKYTSIINKINNKWYPKFADGFDETFINEFVIDLNINISVSFPFGQKDVKMQSYKSDQKALREFRFINTRFNHVELISEENFNETVVTSSKLVKAIELNAEDMDEKLGSLNERNVFNQYMQFNDKICLIRTPSEIYKLKSEENDIISKFEFSIGASGFTYDYIKDYDLCDFISKGIHYTNSYQRIKTPLESSLKIKSLDQEKAYSQFKLCPEYMGFLSKITDFRLCNDVNFAISTIGLYQINNLVLSDKIANIGMNIFINYNIYTSPELKFLIDNRCTFSVICGCWGGKVDFEFNDDMLKKFNNVSLFSKWTGKCDSYNEYDKIIMKGTKELFENLKYYNNDLQIKIFGDKAIICSKKNNIPYKGHITAFITAYQRLNMLHQLMNMDLSKVIRIVTDGIYYYDHKFTKNESFRDKKFDMKNVFTNVGDKLISNIYDMEEINYFNCADFLDHNMSMLYIGAGGTGKTHINLIDNGFNRKLYIAPSWKLATNKKNEYNIDSTVLARISCGSEEAIYYRNNFDVFIFDECSQYNMDDKNKIFAFFSNCKIIFCGDIGYQLPPVSGSVMNSDLFKHVKEFNFVYRFEDPELANICADLRNKISKINKHVSIDKSCKNFMSNKLTEHIKKIFSSRLITINQVPNLYKIEDYILVSKNKCNVHHKLDCNCDGKNYSLEYTELLAECSGKKYIVKANSNNYNNGDIVLEKVPNSIECHAFSIHSIQGETIRSKIFIDLRKMFEPQMLYTAISRAKKLDQLYFIH